MDDFFLKPFLDSLSSKDIKVSVFDYHRITLVLRAGGPWDLECLRGVLSALLVKNPEQEESFVRDFNNFFDPKLEAHYEQELAYLSQNTSIVTTQTKPIEKKKRSDSNTQTGKVKKTVRNRFWPVVVPVAAIITVLLAASLASWLIYTPSTDGPIVGPSPAPTQQRGAAQDPELIPFELETAAAFTAVIAGLFLLFFFRWFSRRRRPLFDPNAPRHFDVSLIGGKPAPFLDSAELDHLASLIAYGESDNVTGRLDLQASVETTTRRAGLPTLIYCKQKVLKTVHIIEDAVAESSTWNSIPEELAEGLELRGVPIVQAKFYDSMKRLETADQTTYWLDQPENQRVDQPLMIFSDGRGIGDCNEPALQALARKPSLAWLELRESRKD